MSRNRRKRFLPFIDTFGSKIREKVSRNRRNDKKCLEMGENENPFLDTFGSRNKRKSVQKQEKRQKVSRNGRTRFLLFQDTFGSSNERKSV